VDESKLYMNRLILGVTHLCTRTRELAGTRGAEPIALMPIRECLDMLGHTVDELANALDRAAAGSGVDGPRAALPRAAAPEPEVSWLVGADEG
jgi:hypothetical protein